MFIFKSVIFLITVLLSESIDVGLRFLFDHGTAGPGSCTDEDFTIIESVIYPEVFDMEPPSHDRSLQYYPAECATLCKGYVIGRCLAAKCRGYTGRFLEEGEGTTDPFDLSSSPEAYFTCNEEKSKVMMALNEMYSQVSDSCRTLLMLPMDIECFML